MFFAPGAVLLQENFVPGQGFWPPQKIPWGFARGGVRAWIWLMHNMYVQDGKFKIKLFTKLANQNS